MKYIAYTADGKHRVGILRGERIQRLDAPDMLTIISSDSPPRVSSSVDQLQDVRVLPPLIPGKILAIGRNYAEHARELNNTVPAEPLVFAVMPSAVIGDGDAVEWEAEITEQVDWEGELAVVIGREARKVKARDALKHVFGYSIGNDISARDLQTRDKQWTRAKGMDTFCPLGPVIVSADEIPDPQRLRIITRVDGVEKQHGATADMIFTVRQLIVYLSRAFTLHPGDVILTGTPSGVGKAQDPPQFLTDGSVVSVEIDGIGKLTNSCRVL